MPFAARWPLEVHILPHRQLTSPRREEAKLKYLAGSEAAMEASIADILPETAAGRLRDVIEP